MADTGRCSQGGKLAVGICHTGCWRWKDLFLVRYRVVVRDGSLHTGFGSGDGIANHGDRFTRLLRFLSAFGLLASAAANWVSLDDLCFPIHFVDLCALCWRWHRRGDSELGNVDRLPGRGRIWRVRDRANVSYERFGWNAGANWSNGATVYRQLTRGLLHLHDVAI